jgi:hypothetical protein
MKKSAWYLHGCAQIRCNAANISRAETESAILFQPRERCGGVIFNTERAYARSDLIAKPREMMQAWADFATACYLELPMLATVTVPLAPG